MEEEWGIGMLLHWRHYREELGVELARRLVFAVLDTLRFMTVMPYYRLKKTDSCD